MKVYTIDDLFKGRGPDVQPRKKRGLFATSFHEIAKKYRRKKGLEKEVEFQRKHPGMRSRGFSFLNKSGIELTPQDEKNIDLIRAMVNNRPDLQKALEGPVKWVGKEGFDTCVAHLSGKKGITNAKALCGYLKEEARNRGTLKPSHMGKIEKKEYLKNRKKGKK